VTIREEVPRRDLGRSRAGRGDAESSCAGRRVAAVLVFGFAPASNALQLSVFQTCMSDDIPLGEADHIDGTRGDAKGNLSGAPYNLDHNDDAMICLDEHAPILG
jgi:hypothetical protein